jgi:ribosomal protein L33
VIVLNNSNESKKLSTKRFAENIKKHTTGKDILLTK